MINNNDETIMLLHLECLTRVYLNDEARSMQRNSWCNARTTGRKESN